METLIIILVLALTGTWAMIVFGMACAERSGRKNYFDNVKKLKSNEKRNPN